MNHACFGFLFWCWFNIELSKVRKYFSLLSHEAGDSLQPVNEVLSYWQLTWQLSVMTTVRGGKFPLTCGFRGIVQWSVPCFIVLALIWGRNILMLGEHGRGYKTHDGHQSGEKERWGKAGGAFQRHTLILTNFREASPTIKIYWCMDFFYDLPHCFNQSPCIPFVSQKSDSLGIKSLTWKTLQGYFISKPQHSLFQGSVSGLSQGF